MRLLVAAQIKHMVMVVVILRSTAQHLLVVAVAETVLVEVEHVAV